MYRILEMGSALVAEFELVTFHSWGFNFLVLARRPSNLSNFIVILFNDNMMQISRE